jgi:hypothetical protein
LTGTTDQTVSETRDAEIQNIGSSTAYLKDDNGNSYNIGAGERLSMSAPHARYLNLIINPNGSTIQVLYYNW